LPLSREGEYHLSPQDAAENPAVSRRCGRLDASVGINGGNRCQNQSPQNPRKLSAPRADVNGAAAHETPCLYPVLFSNARICRKRGTGFPLDEVGGTGHGSVPIPQRRNLSSSKLRIFPVFTATKFSAATFPYCEMTLCTYIFRLSVDSLYSREEKRRVSTSPTKAAHSVLRCRMERRSHPCQKNRTQRPTVGRIFRTGDILIMQSICSMTRSFCRETLIL